MKITIRKATIKDYKTILDLEVALVREMKSFDRSLNWVKFKSKFGKDLKKYLRGKKFVFLLAKKDSEAIGFLNASIERIYTISKKYFYINDIYVKPKYRRQGIAKRLISELYRIGKQKRLFKMRLGVNVKNKTAIRFYKNLNFIEKHIEFDKTIK